MSDPAIRIEIHIDPQIIKAFLAAINVAAITAPVIERFAEKFTEPPAPAAKPEPLPPTPIKLNGGELAVTAIPPGTLGGSPAAMAFREGDMVRLNNPEPPLRVHSGKPDEAHTELQRGELGQITRILGNGTCAVRWNKAPSFEVGLKPEWLLPDADVKFAEPYGEQTTTAYADYARRWLEAAVANLWTREQVQDRWTREAFEIRGKLADKFDGSAWDALSNEVMATMKRLATP